MGKFLLKSSSGRIWLFLMVVGLIACYISDQKAKAREARESAEIREMIVDANVLINKMDVLLDRFEQKDWDRWEKEFLKASDSEKEKMGTQFMNWHEKEQAKIEAEYDDYKKSQDEAYKLDYMKRSRKILSRLLWAEKVFEEGDQ